jgi:hypothetical protein
MQIEVSINRKTLFRTRVTQVQIKRPRLSGSVAHGNNRRMDKRYGRAPGCRTVDIWSIEAHASG